MRALSVLTLLMGATVCSGTTIMAITGAGCADIGNAQALGPLAAGCQATLISSLGSFGIQDLEAVALNTQLGSLGTANGVTISATTCTNCGFPGVTDVSTNEIGYDTTAGAATVRFYQIGAASTGTNSVLTLSFSSGITGFGVYITGIQATLGLTTVSFNSSAQTFVLPTTGTINPATGNERTNPAGSQFFGFTAFDGVVNSITFTTVNNPSVRDIFGLDDFIIGQAVPEPATFGLMGAALVGLAVLRRRRRA